MKVIKQQFNRFQSSYAVEQLRYADSDAWPGRPWLPMATAIKG